MRINHGNIDINIISYEVKVYVHPHDNFSKKDDTLIIQ